MKVTSNSANLSGLPDELLILIFNLVSQADLCSLSLVSRRLSSVADPVLYKTILFDQPKHHLTFSQSLVTRPRRGSVIHDVRLDYPSHELSDLMHLKDGSYPLDGFSHAISTMSNLEKLTVSVPESLLHGIGTLFNGPFDLACLKTCTLFFQTEDGGYWDLQENIHIFSHPTLEILTIRRAKLDQRGFDSLEKPSETALRELHFIECDINDDALADILMHPEALQEITITQLEVPNPELEESPENIDDYILALSSAQHSLGEISIDFPTLGAKNPLRLRDFEVLKSLQLRDFQLFGQSPPRLHSVGLPPSLEFLEFFNEFDADHDEDIVDLLCYFLEHDILGRRQCDVKVAKGENGLPPRIIEAVNDSEHFKLIIC
jgi:hypothetical protein